MRKNQALAAALRPGPFGPNAKTTAHPQWRMGGPGSNDLVGNELWRGLDRFQGRDPRHQGSSAFPLQATVEK
jgi:hypothetical protein